MPFNFWVLHPLHFQFLGPIIFVLRARCPFISFRVLHPLPFNFRALHPQSSFLGPDTHCIYIPGPNTHCIFVWVLILISFIFRVLKPIVFTFRGPCTHVICIFFCHVPMVIYLSSLIPTVIYFWGPYTHYYLPSRVPVPIAIYLSQILWTNLSQHICFPFIL